MKSIRLGHKLEMDVKEKKGSGVARKFRDGELEGQEINIRTKNIM